MLYALELIRARGHRLCVCVRMCTSMGVSSSLHTCTLTCTPAHSKVCSCVKGTVAAGWGVDGLAGLVDRERRARGGDRQRCVLPYQVNLMNPSQTEKRPITADAALMNPVAKILALRSGENLQVRPRVLSVSKHPI